ncbi:hypothetical protein HN512_02840 [Candidatus Peregrinibacteria bacterium]|jgi:hypothetical protein|nr:hypothetical protein [Candidatus Peregrinibacteria bacterium]MBT3598749.1 hypothetical protein [Candidatus Peregrinibacteria bacterium]MBT4586027.1 hypothetical protein [Candidatus Peregrinibacteria bacterium]MBT6731241.1 hypothetical protein [Candidatus Peregrinibacteria bacterium]MBT7008819.1 hypothetical protein [Candidatus Peregrinibacteria bacterium]
MFFKGRLTLARSKGIIQKITESSAWQAAAHEIIDEVFNEEGGNIRSAMEELFNIG